MGCRLSAPCGGDRIPRGAVARAMTVTRRRLITGCGMTVGLCCWSVASARWMRQRQAGPAVSRGQNGRRRDAVGDGHEPSNQPRFARGVREGIDVSSDRIAGPLFREDGGLGRIAVVVDESKI